MQEIWAGYSNKIRPRIPLGKSALGGLNSISLRVSHTEARRLLTIECGARGRASLGIQGTGEDGPGSLDDLRMNGKWERITFKHIDTVSKKLIVDGGGMGKLRSTSTAKTAARRAITDLLDAASDMTWNDAERDGSTDFKLLHANVCL